MTVGERCIAECKEMILSGKPLCKTIKYVWPNKRTEYAELSFVNNQIWISDFDYEIDEENCWCKVTLMEYRQILMLFKADGLEDDKFIRNFYSADYEMLCEWMRHVRDVQKQLLNEDFLRMIKYSKEYNITIKDMFTYMFNDDDYLNKIIKCFSDNDDDIYYRFTKRKHDLADMWFTIDDVDHDMYVREGKLFIEMYRDKIWPTK